MTEVYLVISGALGAFLTALIQWIFNKKGQKEDVRTKAIDNEVKLADYYKQMLDDLQARYESKFNDVVKLYESKEKILRDEITLLNRKIKDLRAENLALRRRLKELGDETKNSSN